MFGSNDWGLIVYDEVHLLPAPVFRVTAEIQATRRLGLTATLVREDEKEGEVFTLIGPKRYDVPWKVLERQGFIAQASCTEVRIPMIEEDRMRYAGADRRQKFRIAVRELHKQDRHADAACCKSARGRAGARDWSVPARSSSRSRPCIGAPIITGKTPNDERIELYGKFRRTARSST